MAELTRRSIGVALSTGGPFDRMDPDGPFVLKPWKDPAALRALEAYRDSCYPELARELSEWIEAIRSGPVVRGGVGGRNEAHSSARPVKAAKVTKAPSRPPAKVKSKARQAKPAKKKRKRR